MHYYEKNSLSIYLKEINKFPLLSKREEIELAKRKDEGDKKAFNSLVSSNLRFVVSLAKRYTGKVGKMPLEDLIAEGNIGLLRATEKYDYRKGVRFSTYSAHDIKQSIMRAISKTSRVVKIPQRLNQTLHNIKRFEQGFYSEKGRLPKVSETSEFFGISYNKINHLLALDEPLSLDSAISVADIRENPEREVMRKICEENVRQIVNSALDKREWDIIQRRFGLNGYNKQTLREVGAEYGLVPETIRLIQEKAFRKLRDKLSSSEI